MKKGARILAVDDEPSILRSLQVNLEEMGYQVLTASSSEQAMEILSGLPPDLIIADLVMSGMDGIELTRRIRETSGVPIVVLSAIGEERKKIDALEAGADDYIVKPFNMGELVARIRAVLRRAINTTGTELVFRSRDLFVNFESREVRLNGNPVKLTPKEYDLLKYLIQNAGKVVTHRMLLTVVWGQTQTEEAHYLRVFVSQLRKKLGEDPLRPQYIQTDPGVGYRFASEITNIRSDS